MTDDLAERVSTLERRVTALEHTGRPRGAPTSEADRPSPREFLMSKPNAKTLGNLGLLAGYYIEVILGKESFDLDELNEFYAAAKEPRPAAYRDIPYQNVKRGIFREVGKRVQSRTAHNRWALTNLGISRVEAGFKTGR